MKLNSEDYVEGRIFSSSHKKRVASKKDPKKGKKMNSNSGGALIGLLAVQRLISFFGRNAREYFRIQSASAYLHAIEVIREFFFYQFSILICAVFLSFGVILIQTAILLYLPMSLEMKAGIGLLMGLIDFFTALGVLLYFSSSSWWLNKAKKHHQFLEQVLDKLSKERRESGSSSEQ